jgi:hypothetical protein
VGEKAEVTTGWKPSEQVPHRPRRSRADAISIFMQPVVDYAWLVAASLGDQAKHTVTGCS